MVLCWPGVYRRLDEALLVQIYPAVADVNGTQRSQTLQCSQLCAGRQQGAGTRVDEPQWLATEAI